MRAVVRLQERAFLQPRPSNFGVERRKRSLPENNRFDERFDRGFQGREVGDGWRKR